MSSRLGNRVTGKVRAAGRRVRRRLRRGVAHRPTPVATSREVIEERTNLGPVMDAAVRRTRARMLPTDVDPDYDLAYEHFDLTHFLLQARHMLEQPRVDPLQVFLDNGPEAKASPEINFSLQAYLARHPEAVEAPEHSPYVHWLRRGRTAGEIADPAPGLETMAPVLGLTPAALADLLATTRSDLQGRLRTGRLGEMFARAAEVEPLIGEAWTATTEPRIPPLVSTDAVIQVAAIHSCQEAAGFAPARLVLVVTEPRWGGGRRVEGHVAHALVRDHIDPHDIVVVYTDASGSAPPGRFPAGVREVDFARTVEGVARPAALRALVELVRAFDADSVININSRLLYEAMATYGRALVATERVYLMMFGNEQLAMGHWVGIPLRFFYRCFDLAEGVLTDSEHLADWLRERHQLAPGSGSDRILVLRAPVDPGIPVVEAPRDGGGRRPQVFWAGRWDRQKRVDIALEVARRMPDVDVRMWGQAVLTGGHLGEVPDNVRLEGRYDHFTDLDLAEADAWLYTSAWDGVPSQLLEVGMTGVPVVASLVGGVGEILDASDSWPVEEWEDPDAYVAALREILADRAAARERSATLRDRLLRQRTEEDYARQVGRVLLHDVREGRYER